MKHDDTVVSPTKANRFYFDACLCQPCRRSGLPPQRTLSTGMPRQTQTGCEKSSSSYVARQRTKVARTPSSHLGEKGPMLVKDSCICFATCRQISAIKFSHDDRFIAAGVGKKVQVWRTPGRRHQIAPLSLVRVYGGLQDDVTCLAWAPDSRHLVAGLKTCFCRYVTEKRCWPRELSAGFLGGEARRGGIF